MEKQKTIDELILDIDLNASSLEKREDCRPITFWLPVAYKNKFDVIQQKSRRIFGKRLKEVIKKSIDKVAAV